MKFLTFVNLFTPKAGAISGSFKLGAGEVSLLNKSSYLALVVTKLIHIRDMILVTLCCVT
jgi:hypothetical protein